MTYNLKDLIQRFKSGEELEYVFFWGHKSKAGQVTKACLSQWYPSTFTVDGVTFNCAEQYMMAEKARVFEDEETYAKILASSDPKEIKALGRKVQNFSTEKWAEVSKDVVVKGNLHKFDQNPELKKFLINTGNKILVEASPYDTIWGIGLKDGDRNASNPTLWKGRNKLGFALMEVRDELLAH